MAYGMTIWNSSGRVQWSTAYLQLIAEGPYYAYPSTQPVGGGKSVLYDFYDL